MKTTTLIKKARTFAKPFPVTEGSKFRLKHVDPRDTLDFKSTDKPRAREALSLGVDALAELQDKLNAQDRWAVPLIFQAMDAAGKDGAIKHVMSGVNPKGRRIQRRHPRASRDCATFLSWSIVVEIDGRCPWRGGALRRLVVQSRRGAAGGLRACPSPVRVGSWSRQPHRTPGGRRPDQPAPASLDDR